MNEYIKAIQEAKTLTKINNILIIAEDKTNNFTIEQINRLKALAEAQKQIIYNNRYIF